MFNLRYTNIERKSNDSYLTAHSNSDGSNPIDSYEVLDKAYNNIIEVKTEPLFSEF